MSVNEFLRRPGQGDERLTLWNTQQFLHIRKPVQY